VLGAEEKPDVTYQDVGGMDSRKQEIREAVEMPLTHFDRTMRSASTLPEECYFVHMGPLVCPLKLTYDKLATPLVAGTGILVKAVAHHTTVSFIRVVGSEFVQKYLGEGPRMVARRVPARAR
jgi:26S proteasome regulatory subunit T3